MGSRNRPRHQEKRKPKGGVKAAKSQPASAYEPPMSVEVIKPKRKPRSEDAGRGGVTSSPPAQTMRRSRPTHGRPGGHRPGPHPGPEEREKSGERGRAVDAAILQIEKQFGRGAIMRLGDQDAKNVEVDPDRLDRARPGARRRRRAARPDHGDLRAGVERQDDALLPHRRQRPARAAGSWPFIDAEHALDPSYAKNVGVNVDELLVCQPDTGEQALEIAETLIRTNGVDVVVIDSVAALVPRAEIEGEMGDSFVGLQARLMSQALRKLTGAINRSKTALVFTNQLREKIGVMFGNPETTPGGQALKFYARCGSTSAASRR